MSQIEEAKRILRDVLDGRATDEHSTLLHGSLDTVDYTREDGSHHHRVKCMNCHMLLEWEDSGHKSDRVREHREGCPIADVEEFLSEKRWPSWPGNCQSCGARLDPPDKTFCNACGSSDYDEGPPRRKYKEPQTWKVG